MFRRLINRVLYKFSKERMEHIKKIDDEIKTINDDLEKIQTARGFETYSYTYASANSMMRTQKQNWTIFTDDEIVRNILIRGLKEYKDALNKKKNKYLSL